MNILVATKETQGRRSNDFSWTEDGELLTLSFECDGERVDGSCGCRRSFSGIESRKATTTAKVIGSEMTRVAYIARLYESQRSAWGDFFTVEDAALEGNELLRLAACFPVGSVLEKRGDDIQLRQRRPATPLIRL